eukprot:jgi/Mesvir1/29202/Mv08097-RA.1
MARRRHSAGDEDQNGEMHNSKEVQGAEHEVLARTESESVVGSRFRRLSLGALVFRNSGSDSRPPTGSENASSKKKLGDNQPSGGNQVQSEKSGNDKQTITGLRRHHSLESGAGGRLGGIRVGNPSELIAAARTSVREKALRISQNFKRPQMQEMPSVTRPDGSVEWAPMRFREVEAQRRSLMNPAGKPVTTTSLGWDNPAYGLDDVSDAVTGEAVDGHAPGTAPQDPDEYMPSTVELRSMVQILELVHAEAALREPTKERAAPPKDPAQLATAPQGGAIEVALTSTSATANAENDIPSTIAVAPAGAGMMAEANSRVSDASGANGVDASAPAGEGDDDVEGQEGMDGGDPAGDAKDAGGEDKRRGLRTWLAKRTRRKSSRSSVKVPAGPAAGTVASDMTEAPYEGSRSGRDSSNKARKQSPTSSPRKHPARTGVNGALSHLQVSA